MRIIIATDIYPPEIGGPAEYAKNLKDVWISQGHKVTVKIFSQYKYWPWGIRHMVFLCSSIKSVVAADYIVALGVFSGGVMTILSKIFFKKIVFRTGGDLLWESYVQRTGDLVLLREFYETTRHKWSFKEKLIFYLLRWALRNLSAIVWSTEWQKNIFLKSYGLEKQKHFFVENYYGPKQPSQEPKQKNFIGGTRKLKWKNLESVERVFNRSEVVQTGANLDMTTAPPEVFKQRVASSYAVVLASLGDISPNTILDAIRYDKPFIVTKETGIYERIKDCAVFIDPKNEDEITEKVVWLSDSKNYALQRQNVINFTFTHGWDEMAEEYLDIWKKI